MMMLTTPIGSLRFIGFLEGLSFLILLGIAMPLKYIAGITEAVFIVGMLHGVLFSLYLLAIGHAMYLRKLTLGSSLMAFIAAFLPFGPFLMDRKFR
jgi:integral membrane protein